MDFINSLTSFPKVEITVDEALRLAKTLITGALHAAKYQQFSVELPAVIVLPSRSNAGTFTVCIEENPKGI